MESALKKAIISALKELIKNIDNGNCDNMTTEQYDKLIDSLNVLIEIKKSDKKIWKFGK